MYSPTRRTRSSRSMPPPAAAVDVRPEDREPRANRGVTYWEQRRRAPAVRRRRPVSLRARRRHRRPGPGFGDGGRIDLRGDLGRDPAEQSIRLTTPGIVYKDLLIVGGRAGEGAGASPGDIRAYRRAHRAAAVDASTPFRTPGEDGYDTWSETSWKVTGGANNWAGMALDERRGHRVRADRVGRRRLLRRRPHRRQPVRQLRCWRSTPRPGGSVWHFQAVHHDIWDRDFPSPPTLVTVQARRRAIDAVAQTTKQGFVFVFERETGKPLFPIEERPVPASTVPGERRRADAADAAPARAVRAPARSRRTCSPRRTPEAHAWAPPSSRSCAPRGRSRRCGSARTRSSSPASTAAPSGAAAPTIRRSGSSTSTPTTWPGPARWRRTTAANDGRGALPAACATCHRDDRRGAPPQIPVAHRTSTSVARERDDAR